MNMKWTVVRAWVMCLLCALSLIVNARAEVQGAWQPRLALADADTRTEASPPDFANAWQTMPQMLRLVIPAKTRAAYEIASEESLPEGDWTLEFAVIQHDEFVPARFEFFIGEPKAGSLQLSLDPGLDYAGVDARLRESRLGGSMNIDTAAGPIHWLRLVRDARAGTLQIFVNGVPLWLAQWKADAVLPRGPLRCRFYTNYAHEKPVAIEVAAFTVRTEALHEADSIPGLAFNGWPAGANLKWTPALRQKFDAQLQGILAAPDADGPTRAHAIAARVLGERAATGALSDATWNQAAKFITKTIDLDLNEFSRLLPIVIASADVAKYPARKAIAEIWTRRLLDGLPSPRDNQGDVMPLLQRAALLDPARTATAISGRNISLPFARALASDLKTAAPLKGFAAFRTFERSFPDAEAWLLPETSAISPLWSGLVIQRLRFFATQKAFVSGQPDRALASAAYRLASTQLATSLEFAELIKAPDVKAEALEAVAGVLPANAGRDLDASIESALRASINAWKASSRDDSAVPQKVRLAQWLFARGRKDEARKILDEAAAQIGALPATRFRDTWAIARAARDMKMPDAKLWLDKATAAAAARDADADEFGGGFYLSATVIVVGELAKNGQIDEALALIGKLDRDALSDNYDLSLARIVFALSKNDARCDLPRALKLAQDLSPGNQRDIVMASLAGNLASTDMTAALQIFEELSEDKQLGAAFGMLSSAPPAQTVKLQALVGEAIASHLKEWKTVKRHDTHQKLVANVARLPVSALLDLEPYFKDDHAFFATQLLNAIARDADWQSTPLWKRYLAADNTSNGWSVPWGLGHLRDSIRAEESNRENGLE